MPTVGLAHYESRPSAGTALISKIDIILAKFHKQLIISKTLKKSLSHEILKWLNAAKIES